jgi:hypothetical protein
MEMEPEVRKGADARLLLEVTLLSNMTRPVPLTVPVAAPTTDAVGGERVIEPVIEPAVRIEFRYPAHAELMQKASNRETLLVAIREIFGPEARVELVAGEKKPGTTAPAPVRQAESIADDPLVKEAMNRFDATNVRVTPRGRG